MLAKLAVMVFEKVNLCAIFEIENDEIAADYLACISMVAGSDF
jgi:hypothetical protein